MASQRAQRSLFVQDEDDEESEKLVEIEETSLSPSSPSPPPIPTHPESAEEESSEEEEEESEMTSPRQTHPDSNTCRFGPSTSSIPVWPRFRQRSNRLSSFGIFSSVQTPRTRLQRLSLEEDACLGARSPAFMGRGVRFGLTIVTIW
jgi:hypothetical protein